MNLSKRSGNGIFELKYVNPLSGKSSRVSTGKRTRAEAELWAKDYASQNPVTNSKQYSHTLSESLWDTYRRIWSKQKGHKSTYAKVGLIDGKIGDMKLADVTYDSMTHWVEREERRHRKPQTVGRDVNIISKTLHEAWRLGWIIAVPPLPKCQPAATIDRYISYEEEELLIECATALQPKRWMCVLVDAIPFLCDTGCRLGELLKIDTSNIRWSGTQPMLYLQPAITKNNKARTIPLTKKAYDHLLNIFANPDWDEKRPGQTHLTQQFSAVRDMADLPDVHLHILRHTCASRLVQAGEDFYRIATWLGHSDTKVTERYAHLKPDHLMSAMSKLER